MVIDTSKKWVRENLRASRYTSLEQTRKRRTIEAWLMLIALVVGTASMLTVLCYVAKPMGAILITAAILSLTYNSVCKYAHYRHQERE